MIPLTPNDLQCGTVRVKAMDLLLGKAQELTTKNGSTCLFFEPFMCGDYTVQLRFDFHDLDNQGNPMLDADFINPNTGKHDKSMRAHPAHHTQAQVDGSRIYQWEFGEAQKMLLRIELVWSISLLSPVGFTDVCTNELTRAGIKIS